MAVLFRSAARGDDRHDSDIDLLVELADHRRGGLPLARIGLKLESLLERPVQLVSVPDAEMSVVLLSEAIADGRVLIDRDDRWSCLKRREQTLRRRAREDETRAQAEAWDALLEARGRVRGTGQPPRTPRPLPGSKQLGAETRALKWSRRASSACFAARAGSRLTFASS